MGFKYIRLGDVSRGRNNNFNLIRITAAFSVLISHSYPLALGPSAVEPLQSTGLKLGHIAVLVFFGISGFLIANSADRSNMAVDFLWARILRIMPALLTALVITVYMIGPIVTSMSPAAFVMRPYNFKYILANATFITTRFDLLGVFNSNPYPTAVNGSIWTLRFEVYCYVIALMCGIASLYKVKVFPVFLAPAIGLYAFFRLTSPVQVPEGGMLSLVLPFLAGMTLYAYRNFIPMHWGIAATAALFTAALSKTPFYFEAFCASCAYITIYVAYLPTPALHKFNSLGDYSYGTYIYAWPIAQTIMFLFKPHSPFSLTIATAAITLPIAILSWHFVEAPALAAKRFLAAKKPAVGSTNLQ